MRRKRGNEISLDERSQDHSYAQFEDESNSSGEESSSSSICSSTSSADSFPNTPRTRADDEEIDANSSLPVKIEPDLDQDAETGVKVKKRKLRKYITAEFVESDDECHRTYEKEKIVVQKKDYFTNSVKCDKCEYTSNRSNVKRHSRVHTGSYKKGLTCPEDGCERKYIRIKELDRHLTLDHQRELLTETMYMADEAELKRWIRGIKETESFYYLVGQRKENWSCSLSSINKPKKSTATGLRKLKPSNKSDRRVCTSRLVISTHEGGLKVEYHKTHSGHSMEKPQRDGLTPAQKRDTAKMIMDGVSRSVVLDRLKTKYIIEGKNACKLTDIYNIANKIQATQEKERRQQEELEQRDNFTFYTYPELGEPMNEDLDIELNLKLADDYYNTAREFATNPKLAEKLACKMKALVESLKQPAEPEPDPDSTVEVPMITNVVSMQKQQEVYQPNSTQKRWTSSRKKTNKTKKAQSQVDISTIDLNCNLFEDLIFT